MRILLVIPNLRGGGAERVTINLARGLAERSHSVTLLLLFDQVEYETPAAVRVQHLWRVRRGGWLIKRLLARSLRRWLAKEESFDLVVAILPFASEIVLMAGVETAWHHVHTTLSVALGNLSRDEKRKAARRRDRYRRMLDGKTLLAVSDGVAFDLKTRMGLSRSRILTVYNPHDLEEIRRLAAAPEPDLPSVPYILHAARMAPGKRHDLLLEAFAVSEIPHHLVLLTEDTRELRALIEARGLSSRVSIVGFRRNPFAWYRGASAVLLSSDYEGLPNVLIEALVVGTPAVSTDCESGPREILRGPLGGYLSPPGDAVALARNLTSAITAPPTIDPRLLERFSMKNAIDQFEEAIRAHSTGELFKSNS